MLYARTNGSGCILNIYLNFGLFFFGIITNREAMICFLELGTSEDKLSKLYKTLEGKQLEIEKYGVIF